MTLNWPLRGESVERWWLVVKRTLTRAYQEQIRHSPLWDQMVREFGLAGAEELLREFRAELR